MMNTKTMVRIFFALLLMLQCAIVAQAQDDMYGDDQPNKTKKPKSTKTPSQQTNNSNTTSPSSSQNSQTAPMPAGTPCSVVYLMRPIQNFYGNNGVFQIKFNGVTVTELKTGSRVAFTMYTEGTLKINCQYKTPSSTEFYKTITIDIKKGGAYYIMLSYLFDQTKQLDAENGSRLWKDEQQFKVTPLNLYESPQAPLTIKPAEPAPSTTQPTTNNSNTISSTPIAAGQTYYTNGMLLGGGYIAVPLSTVEKGGKWIIITDDGIRLNAKLISSDKTNNLGVLKITDSLYRDPGCSVFTEKIPATGDTMTCLYKDYNNGVPQLHTMKVLVKQPVVSGSSPFVYSMNAPLPASVHSGIILDRFGKISGLGMPDNGGLVQSALKHQYVRTYGESLGASSPNCSGTESADPFGNNTARVILIEVSK